MKKIRFFFFTVQFKESVLNKTEKQFKKMYLGTFCYVFPPT